MPAGRVIGDSKYNSCVRDSIDKNRFFFFVVNKSGIKMFNIFKMF